MVLELPGPTVSRTNDAIRLESKPILYTSYTYPIQPTAKKPPHPFDANAAPTQFNPSIVLSEESEIQSPRFPVFLVVILPFLVLRNSSGKHMKLVPAETPIFLSIDLVCVLYYSSNLYCNTRKHRPCSFPPERWSPARSRLLKSVWPENLPGKNPPPKN